MSTKTKGAALASVFVSALMLFGGACGGSSDKGSDTSGNSGDPSSVTTDKSGSNASSCADLFNVSEELSTRLDAMSTAISEGTSNSISAEMIAMAATLDSFTPSVPSDVRGDWKIIVAGFRTYADALQGVDFTNLSDAATMEKLSAAAATMDDAKYAEASANLEAWITKNCPSYALK